MSLVSLFKNTFLKSRVIGLSFQAQRVMAQMAKTDFENPDEHFLLNDAMKYNELVFYGRLAENWSINPELFGKAELAKYNEAKQTLIDFNQYHALVQNLHEFYWELKTIYLELSRGVATSNFHNKREVTHSIIESDIKNSIHKYIQLIDDLKDYPEWQHKVREEIGYYAHMIYTSVNHDGNFPEIFKEFNKVDSLYYFK
ncbi:hypothetical protein TTHERM_00283850 (macronuclear) [Tetrahymena thermophila SB210]|uniref:Uncharacterized protein n=1 Tax=Tetrahymena thermophila (strain SB210) TaxID=312017 RepID=I7MEX7_TETTS|nr:hypothetical protein TTHERM_00283850 [Tetrahymena thermophila SB210]8B6G_CG Chain CG, SDHTT3 [Tetrahymena thermophila]8BQS_CG Chain CG, Uncharacterized protein [Tetrahymena thermophila SB210]8GYM_2G Chain 2G, SDHTT3 [Tetrahymena thermophila SB210]8GYM_2g Chain 2g, SDHTT3 [Tetrahymena thermophila SB210]8GZU_2G Chain 2G, SDHTT3 [Tetrahymena thermophila SB210]8GZU_2g Chain 2g, SDHTT3 [Tetrahymena thermophila SB210]EAR97996.2 hypothetical protein TTHERM_00283850 [Tetrahymena thermophila SB210|eukprot:XP_001018241.2 hypothetical protein TTHERM_00283850 [Tetrahymena thermophila SB210]